jgi:dienelactone hydrolase
VLNLGSFIAAYMIVSQKDLRKRQRLASGPWILYVRGVKRPPVRTIRIDTSDVNPVRGDLYSPAGRATGVVILCHGFKGYKTWGFLPYLAERLRERGMAALSIDTSHNGTFPGDEDGPRYPRPDLFRRNTLRREFEDVATVVRFVRGGGIENADPDAVGLFGHSRGGVAVTLVALETPGVRALCTWSLVDDPDFYTEKQKERWRKNGVYSFVDIEGTELGVGVEYLNDLEEHHTFYHLGERVKSLTVPHLIVHGESDMVIPVASARALHDAEAALRDKGLIILRTGHTFGVPYAEVPDSGARAPALVEAADVTVEWFEHFLSGRGQ